LKIILNPVKETIINQIVEIDIERITKIQAISNNSLGWVNGILFYIMEYDDEYFSKKQSEGTWYVELFVYSVCGSKPDFLKYNGFQVEILDFTGFSVIENLTKSILELVSKN